MAARAGKDRTGTGKARGKRPSRPVPPPGPAEALPRARQLSMSRKRGHPPAPAVVRETAVVPAGTVPAGVFKATCLNLMDRVRERREEIVITKYGKPVAKLVPVADADADATRRTAWGWMKGTVLWYGDIISPIDVEWEAMKD